MQRRWGGALMVFIVLLVAAVVPNIAAKAIPGTAHSATIPGPPNVGDCLTAPAHDSWDLGDPSYAPRSLAPCVGSRFGEVVAVIQDGRAAGVAQAPIDGSALGVDPNQPTCRDAAWRYLGFVVGADDHPKIGSLWSPVSYEGVAPAGPSPLQKAAGRNWVACVLLVTDDNGASVSYSGSAKGGFLAGTAPGAFGTCASSVDLRYAQVVSCGKPHRVEAFGTMGTARPGLTLTLLDHSCGALAAQLTGMADPTRKGQLRITAAAVHGQLDPSDPASPAAPGLGAANDQSGFAACFLSTSSTRQLTSSLLGWGAKPLPLTR